MTRIFLKPAIDKNAAPARMKVRKPIGGYLSTEGEFQNLDSYWRRRINDGDVELVDGVVEQEQPAAPDAPPPQTADSGLSKPTKSK